MKLSWLAFITAVAALAQTPATRLDPFVGIFEGRQVALELKGSAGHYAGILSVQGQSFPATVTANGASGTGSFLVNGQEYRFTLTPVSDGFNLTSEGHEYLLTRRGGAETTAVTPSDAPGPLIGSWRNAQGYARFNADGTGEVDGTLGRYEVHGSQLTMTGVKGSITVPFSVTADRLTMMIGGSAVVLNREVPRPAEAPGIRKELIGKWCWISQVNAQEGARHSNRCLTLDSNGTYLYEGLTDSHNPNGGAASQSRDVGTWEATENTLTGTSRTGKTVTYRLEKRNHPKNNDPMILLDGQAFVTFYKKAPW